MASQGSLAKNARDFGARLGRPRKRLKLSVILPRGFHPFPSRTRKLSPAGPIVLHAKVCGRVGRCRHKLRARLRNQPGSFPFSLLACLIVWSVWSADQRAVVAGLTGGAGIGSCPLSV